MTRAFVDTNIILRFFLKENKEKREVFKRLLKMAERKELELYIPPVTIMEVVWVLEKVYRLKREKIKDVIESILNTIYLKIEDREVFRKAISFYAEKKVKFSDALMSSWALSRGIKVVWTFDEEDFRKIGELEIHGI